MSTTGVVVGVLGGSEQYGQKFRRRQKIESFEVMCFRRLAGPSLRSLVTLAGLRTHSALRFPSCPPTVSLSVKEAWEPPRQVAVIPDKSCVLSANILFFSPYLIIPLLCYSISQGG